MRCLEEADGCGNGKFDIQRGNSDLKEIEQEVASSQFLNWAFNPTPHIQSPTNSAMGEAGWICNACTFHNVASHEACSMCHSFRFRFRSNVSSFLSIMICGVYIGIFATVGGVSGAVMGAFARRAEHRGLFRGASLGAVTGAFLSIHILDALFTHWHSHSGSRSLSLSSMGNFVKEVLSGRFFQEHLPSYVSATADRQSNAAEIGYEELFGIFAPGKITATSEELLESLPQHQITQDNRIDTSGDAIHCMICLQELEQGDTARSLPICHHTFHMRCVDKWLIEHVSCPVCRHSIKFPVK